MYTWSVAALQKKKKETNGLEWLYRQINFRIHYISINQLINNESEIPSYER